MLGRVLGRHSAIHTFGELHFFEEHVDLDTMRQRPGWPRDRLVALLERLLTSARDGLFSAVEPGRYRAEAEAVLSATGSHDPLAVYAQMLRSEAARHGKRLPCEQTPRYIYCADEILAAFPEARIVCIVRDPRAVLLSQKKRWRRGSLGGRFPVIWTLRSWASYHPYTTARFWVSASRIARRLASDPRVCIIRYEDFVSRPAEVLGGVCETLGLPFEENMTDIPRIGSSSRRDAPEATGVDSSRVGAWREGGLSPGEIAICERIAADEMRHWGYDLVGAAVSPTAAMVNGATFVAKSTAALALNLRRFRNLRQAVRRRLA